MNERQDHVVGEEPFMKSMKSSFFAKLFLNVFLVAMIPLLLITAVLYGFSERIFRSSIEEESLSYVEEVEKDVVSLYSFYEEAVLRLSKDPLVLEILNKQAVTLEETRDLYEKMYLLFSGKTNEVSLYILGNDGVTLFASDTLPKHYDTKSYPGWGVLRKVSETPMEVVFHSASQRERDLHDKSLTAAMGITMEETLKGVILVDVHREAFSEILQGKSQGNIWEAAVLNEIGNVLYAKNSLLEEGRPLDRYPGHSFYDRRGSFSAEKEGSDFYGAYLKSTSYPFEVLTYASLSDVESNARYLLKNLLYIGTLTLLISLLASYRISKSVSKPVKDLVHHMKKIEKGDFSERFQTDRTDEMGELMERYNKMAKRLDLLIRNMIESRDRLKKSEMKMLQSQINPHFLYNTLDTIKWMAKMGESEEVVTLITNLAKLLRISLEDAEEYQTVDMNLSWLKSYLEIQKARYDDDLTYEIHVEESLYERKIPKLLLQPIVENAILHGLDGKGKIVVSGYEEEKRIVFEVEDDGKGMEEDQRRKLLSEHAGEGIGLLNVHKRIELYYGKGYGLEIKSKVNQGTKVRMVLGEGGL